MDLSERSLQAQDRQAAILQEVPALVVVARKQPLGVPPKPFLYPRCTSTHSLKHKGEQG